MPKGKLWFGKESKTVGRRPTPCKPLKRLYLNFNKSKRECIRQIKIFPIDIFSL